MRRRERERSSMDGMNVPLTSHRVLRRGNTTRFIQINSSGDRSNNSTWSSGGRGGGGVILVITHATVIEQQPAPEQCRDSAIRRLFPGNAVFHRDGTTCYDIVTTLPLLRQAELPWLVHWVIPGSYKAAHSAGATVNQVPRGTMVRVRYPWGYK